MIYRVAVIEWDQDGGAIGEAIVDELRSLGHSPLTFPARAYSNFILSGEIDVLFLFGPFGPFSDVLRYISQMPLMERPTTLFWNTEGFPDLKTPWPVMRQIGLARAWASRQVEDGTLLAKMPGVGALLTHLDERMIRYRNIGDFVYASQRSWLDIYGDISAVYAHYLRRRAGFDPVAAPFGGFHKWYDDQWVRNPQAERDIDVMWMGKRATGRRSQLLDRLQSDLSKRGIELLLFDDEAHPFIFDDERTAMLNRCKINVNLLRTWYDENSLRFCIAAPNGSMIASEPLLPHVSSYEEGVHYVSAPIESLADRIVYYLENEDERRQIAENAYHLLTGELTFQNSIKRLMDRVAQIRGDEQTPDILELHP